MDKPLMASYGDITESWKEVGGATWLEEVCVLCCQMDLALAPSCGPPFSSYWPHEVMMSPHLLVLAATLFFVSKHMRPSDHEPDQTEPQQIVFCL